MKLSQTTISTISQGRPPRGKLAQFLSNSSLVAVRALVLVAVSTTARASVAPPLIPLVYEKPNSGDIEVIWFHPEFHQRTVGNLLVNPPARFGHPLDSEEEALVVSQVAALAPFGVSRIAAAFNPDDPEFGEAGAQYTALRAQFATERELVVANPTDISMRLLDSSGVTTLVELGLDLTFDRGDTLFAGLQWSSVSPTQPQVGLQSELGGFQAQSFVRFDSPTPSWEPTWDRYGMELDILDWRARDDGSGSLAFWYAADKPEFTVWFSPDTLRPIESAYDWATSTSGRLSWRTFGAGSGFVALFAEDSAANRSDTMFAPVDISKFGKLSFSHAQMAFDWAKANTLTQTLAITNTSPDEVRLTLVSDNPLIVFDTSSFTMSGGGVFKLRKVSALSAPIAFDTVEAAIYIYNDRDWAPVKMDVYLVPDIQTSVEDEFSVKPISFAASDVFPNPTRGPGSLRITTERQRSFLVEIYNVLGQVLHTSEVQARGEVDVAIQVESTMNYPSAAGVYFVRVSSDGESLMRKFVLLK